MEQQLYLPSSSICHRHELLWKSQVKVQCLKFTVSVYKMVEILGNDNQLSKTKKKSELYDYVYVLYEYLYNNPVNK